MDNNDISKLVKRPHDSHKFDYGHVLVIGGAVGMAGAPLLAARAALRGGAGLVTLAAEAAVLETIGASQPELLTHGVTSPEALLDYIAERRVSCVVIGPGMVPNQQLADLVAALINQADIQLVIDGGALTMLAQNLDWITPAGVPIVLTPHPGEFKRLTGRELPTDRADQESLAADFSRDHDLTLVLKGNSSYVCSSNGQSYRNDTGNPGMATAGSGDVLAGLIGALMAQATAPFKAASIGVRLHGLAGDQAAQAKTQPGMITSDIIDYLPSAWLALQNDNDV